MWPKKPQPPQQTATEILLRKQNEQILTMFAKEFQSLRTEIQNANQVLDNDDRAQITENNEYNYFTEQQAAIIHSSDSAAHAQYVRVTRPRFYENLTKGRYSGR
jgi:hypothetical protein